MIRVVTVAALAASIGAASVARAQSTEPLVPGNRDASAQLARIVDATRDAGLPVDPILAQVNYGVRMVHAEPARIVASARAIAARLKIARDALAPASPNDIIAGADALRSGATDDALRAVRGASGGRPVATPLGVLAQLIETKVPVDRATEIVTNLMRRGVTADQLVALGNNVNDDVRGVSDDSKRGAAALAALDARARFLSGVLAPAARGAAVTAFSPSGQPPKKP